MRDAVFALDQLHDCGSAPKRKIHLQLLWALVAHGALHGLFLLYRQGAVLATAPTACAWRQAGQPQGFKALNGLAHRRVAQPHFLGNLRSRSPSFM